MSKRNDIYIVATKYGRGAFGFKDNGEDCFYSFCPEGKFVPWVEKIIKENPTCGLRCVKNEGITAWLEKRKEIDDLFAQKIAFKSQQER